MELRRIEEKELNDFVMGSLNVHYMKTGMWARFKEKTDHDRHEFFGFYEENRLV